MAIKSRKSISLAVLAVSILWLYFYIKGHFSEFSIISDLSLRIVGILFVLHCFGSVFLGLFNKVLLHHLDISLKFKEWFGLSVVAAFWNYIVPFRGGAGVRALYLKKVHNFAITDFLGTMAALYFIHFLVNACIGLICVFFIYVQYQYLNITISTFFLVVFLAVFFFIFFPPRVRDAKNQILNKIHEVVNGWNEIRKNSILILQLNLIVMLNAVVGLLTVYFSFKAYGINLSLIKSTLISTMFAFSTLINITPGSLGVTEAVMVFSAQIFHITPAQSLVAAGLIRVVNLCLVFVLGPIFNYVLSKRAEGLQS